MKIFLDVEYVNLARRNTHMHKILHYIRRIDVIPFRMLVARHHQPKLFSIFRSGCFKGRLK
jgi:hypothetical protein